MASFLPVTSVYYPESDGKPMGETDLHRDEMIRHIQILENHYQGRRVYVSGDLLVYYEQGNPRKYVVPDAFVVHGIEPTKRRIYQIWVERKTPDVIIETTSRKTRRKDTTDKPLLYASLGVSEYFLFDPTGEYLDPTLQGYRLDGHAYRQLDPEADGSLTSQQLGMRLRAEGGHLQFYLLDTGARLLTGDERAEQEAERAKQEAERAEQEAARRVELEAELTRLREELARLSSGESSSE